MQFTEWIQTEGTKKIITDRVMNGNRLLRKCSLEKGLNVKLTSCVSLQQIAEELLLAWTAFEEGYREISFLNPEACVYILDEVLRTAEYPSIPLESRCIRTTEEILRILNQLRMNNVTVDFEESQDLKIADLKRMREAYEKQLRDNGSYDYALLLDQGIAIFKQIEAGRVRGLRMYLPWTESSRIGILEDLELTAKEESFLRKFVELAGGKTEVLQFYSDGEHEVAYEFFSAYGPVNEVRYVADQLADKGYPYGLVNLFYTAPEYENFIKAVFESRGIPCRFLSGESIAASDPVRFMLTVLDFISEDYLYETLSRVMDNPSISFENVIKDDVSDGVKNPATCYNHFLRKGIGWGRERYQECIDYVKADPAQQEKYQYFLEFLEDLMQIVVQEAACGEFYRRLLAFTAKYVHFGEWGNKRIMPVLKDQVYVMDQIAGTDDREECLQLIKEHLLGLSLKGDSDPAAVNVIRVQNLEVLERPYNYVIGMSAKQFAADTTESPVLSDEELMCYLKEKPILAADAGKRLRQNLERTFLTLETGLVVMGYSTFDTIELKEGSPSVFYLDYLENAGAKIKQIKNQPFKTLHGAIKISEEAVREQMNKIRGKDEQVTVLSKESISMSSSALQMLVKCPIEYYYKYVLNLPGRDFQKKDASGWMNAAQKGNLFHWTMEEYCDCMLQGKLLESGIADKAVFTEIFDKKVEEMLRMQPYVSGVVFEKEREESRETAWEYLTDFQQELYQAQQREKKWRILGSELDFSDIQYTVKDPEGVHPNLIIAFNGSIDRLDGYVGEKGLLFLRITDYKTGRRKKKEAEIKNEHQLQHHVYAMAALQYVRDNREALSQLFGVQITYPVIESIQYVFPYELKKDQVLDTTKKVYECIREMRVELPESVNVTLWNTLGYMNCGKELLARSYMESYLCEIEEKLKKEFERKGPCKYCDYHRQCRRKVGTDL